MEAADGCAAVSVLREDRNFDLCIMDIMMPKLSGVDATLQIRKFSDIPILFLTAKSLDSDKAAAYSSGGDDYLIKPFSAPELLMKVEALTRRYNTYRSKELTGESIRLSQGVTVLPEVREVTKNGDSVDLSEKEFDLLMYLAKNRGRAIDPRELYSSVWGEMPLPSSNNNITVHILNLRRKLEDDQTAPKLIRTVWGKGYQID
jgi:DNA-binding response OmpR family regulator